MLQKLVKAISKPFMGTGITRYLPFLFPIYEFLYSKSANGEVVELKLSQQAKLKVWDDDTCVGAVLLTKGEYEPFETQILLSKAQGKTVFDVGANIGYYTVQLGKVAKKVVGFEPDREIRELLEENLRINALGNMDIRSLALGAREGEIGFRVNRVHRGKSAITVRDEYDYSVQVQTLDNFIDQSGIQPDIIKVDIEGAEIDMLKGGKSFLSSAKDLQLFLEYNPDSLKDFGYQGKDMINLLLEYGFGIQIIDEDKKQLIDYSEASLAQVMSRHTYTNLYCWKTEVRK